MVPAINSVRPANKRAEALSAQGDQRHLKAASRNYEKSIIEWSTAGHVSTMTHQHCIAP